jgi:hypothetical protein
VISLSTSVMVEPLTPNVVMRSLYQVVCERLTQYIDL